MSSKRAALSLLPAALATAVVGLACGGREGDEPAATQPAPAAAPEAPPDQAALPQATKPDAPALPPGIDPEALRRVADAHRKRQRELGLSDKVRIDNGGEPIELPGDYPADIPLYPDAQPIRYVASTATGAMTVMQVGDSTHSVRNFYVRELAGEGWALQSDQSLLGITIVTALKDERELAVTIEDREGETRVVVVESRGKG